jgi:hypothetical protein
MLEISIISAQVIPRHLHLDGSASSYCIVSISGREPAFQTPHVTHTLSPVWTHDNSFRYDVKALQPHDVIKFEVLDQNLFKKSSQGTAVLPLWRVILNPNHKWTFALIKDSTHLGDLVVNITLSSPLGSHADIDQELDHAFQRLQAISLLYSEEAKSNTYAGTTGTWYFCLREIKLNTEHSHDNISVTIQLGDEKNRQFHATKQGVVAWHEYGSLSSLPSDPPLSLVVCVSHSPSKRGLGGLLAKATHTSHVTTRLATITIRVALLSALLLDFYYCRFVLLLLGLR